MEFRLVVKGFVVRDEEVLLIKRSSNDVMTPGIWEVPGGRLNVGEDPYVGLNREMDEEVGISVQALMPLSVKHFTRSDGQVVTFITFVCQHVSGEVVIGEDHSAFDWISFGELRDKIDVFYSEEVERLLKFKEKGVF